MTTNDSPRARHVLVTGVGREGQVGEALAWTFARAGWTVAIADRDAAQVEARAAALRGAGHEVVALAADLTEPAAADAALARVRDAFGGLDALVCAAGGFGMTGALDGSDPAAWHRQFAINLTTAYLSTRGALPLLRPRRGAIVYFGSVAAIAGGDPSGMAAYAAAKAGVLALMHAVARQERDAGVRANAVAPTAVRTGDNEAAMGRDAAYVERDEVAGTVLWLCSDAARAITGQVVRLGS